MELPPETKEPLIEQSSSPMIKGAKKKQPAKSVIINPSVVTRLDAAGQEKKNQ